LAAVFWGERVVMVEGGGRRRMGRTDGRVVRGLYRRHRRALFGFPDPQNRTSFRSSRCGAVAVRWWSTTPVIDFYASPKTLRTLTHTRKHAYTLTQGARFVPLHLTVTAAAGSQPGETSSSPPPVLSKHRTTTSAREYLIISVVAYHIRGT